jgi:broad specificity phosphatase PhoE
VVLVVLAAIPAGAMTVTFIRHAESEGNASGVIDTRVPGPPLTDLGREQASHVADRLVEDGIDFEAFDNLYVSTMIRTQQTAAPLAWALDKTPIVIGTYDPDKPRSVAGIQEISAGVFEGTSQEGGIGRLGYALIPVGWALGLRFLRIPGSEDGNEFDARVDAAIEQMRAGGDTNGDDEINVAAFSHGATIMFWTLMNVDNPNLALMFQHPLENTDIVLVEENGRGGWTLKSYAGIEVGEANYLTKMFVNLRDLIVAPQTALYNLRQPVLDLDGRAIIDTAAQGVRDVGTAAVKFVENSITDTIEEIRRHFPTPPAQTVTTLAARTTEDDASATEPTRDVVKQLRTARSELATSLAEKRRAVTANRTERRDLLRAKAEERRERVRESLAEVRDSAQRSLGVRKGKSDNGSAASESDAA